ncbi:hypothetical protein [Methanoregula sp.]|jgi:hypothetical protein|uniref:hypothetical protein n=1 Tax=Methanoregula sp. TaxID=2052170 RepID=UPI003C201421
MKRILIVFSIIALACLITVAGAATSTVSVMNPQDAAALVYVSGYDLNPGVFYPGETGTLTVHVTNAANASVAVSQPDLMDPHVDIVNKGAFATTTLIGPGATTDYTFVIRADGPDGTYLPLFSVSTNAWGTFAIHAQIKLKVDSTDVRASVSNKPNTFSLEKTDTVNVTVMNPRLGDISDVLIVASSPGSDISPSEENVVSIPAGTSVKVPFAITPHQQSDVTFNVSFRNGDNVHTTTVVLPLNIGEDKSAAIPLISNVALVGNAGTYTMTGEIGNAGITDAQGMVVSVGAPEKPVGPYPDYQIGSLASNDFSRFTLTFVSSDLTSVPVQIRWKDSEGNTQSSTITLDLHTLAEGSPGGILSSATGSTTGLNSFNLVIAGVIIVLAGIVLYMKRKWITSKLKKQ